MQIPPIREKTFDVMQLVNWLYHEGHLRGSQTGRPANADNCRMLQSEQTLSSSLKEFCAAESRFALSVRLDIVPAQGRQSVYSVNGIETV